ncbi:MAG TPA: hypothetical protein VIW80_18205 [Pyrinomonadaceae bacterium]|jgi:hypothetical protein
MPAQEIFENSLLTRYPLKYTWRNDVLYDFDEGMVELMEFRLVYEGPLPSGGNSSRHVKYKHLIRKQLHPQLSRLWHEHPALAHKWKVMPDGPVYDILRQARLVKNVPGINEVEMLARQFDRCGFRFVPLVNKRFDLVCSLNILFLRRGNPGDLIAVGGDIDNRIKTLFDALRIPKDGSEISEQPGADENPFFCLLEDDSLITEFNVTTDRLLRPARTDEGEAEVVLIIQVTVKATEINLENLQLMS